MTRRLQETFERELEWESKPRTKKLDSDTVRFDGENALVRDLQRVIHGTDEDVFKNALERLRELGLDGRDFGVKINALCNKLPSMSDIEVAVMVDRLVREQGCSHQSAFEQAAVSLQVVAKNFDSAVKAVSRSYERYHGSEAAIERWPAETWLIVDGGSMGNSDGEPYWPPDPSEPSPDLPK